MKNKLVVLLALVMLSTTGCQKKASSSSEISSNIITTKSSTTTSINASDATAPPQQSDKIESDSEDIIDDITKSDWASAQSKVDDIILNFNELKPTLISASVSKDVINGLSSAIDSLKSSVASKTSLDSRIQANQISKYIPDIYDYYKVTVPTDVGRLDYLGREINLNVEKNDWTSVSSNYDTADKLWKNLKAKLGSSYQKDIDTFQSNMDSLKDAIDKKNSANITDQANALLENVDTLEKDFTGKK